MIKFKDEVDIVPQLEYFKISRSELSNLFEPDNILDNLST